MEVMLNIPDAVAAQLQLSGGDLARLALEVIAIERYRAAEELSLGQVAEMLGLTTYKADGFLKERGVPLNYTLEDMDWDSATLAALIGK